MKNSLLVFIILLLSLRGYSQNCTLTASISSNAGGICSGNAVTLTANPSGGTGPYTYAWNTGATKQSIPVSKAGTYTVIITDNTTGCTAPSAPFAVANLTAPAQPTANAQPTCPNSPATLTATAPGGVYSWYDSNGVFLANGATYVTPPLSAPASYYVETTMGGCTSTRTQVDVTIVSNPGVAGATVCSGNPAILQATGAQTYAWYTAPTGGNPVSTNPLFTTPVLFNTTVYYLVGTTGNCSSPRIPVTATVTPPPQDPVVPPASVCSGLSVTLHATAPVGVIDWYAVPGGPSLITSPDFTTPPLTTTTTYYVQTTVNTCTSNLIPVTVTVNPIPATPIVPPVAPVCPGGTASITPSSPVGVTFEWFDAQTGGKLLFTGNTFSPVVNTTTTYYVRSNDGCFSATTPVTATVTSPPPAPTVNAPIICPGNTATLTAIAPGGTYTWYDSAGGFLVTNASYTTPPLAVTTSYFVQATVAGCAGPKAKVTVTVIPATPGPTVSPVAPVCAGDPATLIATGGAGTYDWYDASGNHLVTGQVYGTPPLSATTTFYVSLTQGNSCPSALTPVTVTVNQPPPAPAASAGPAVCPGSPVTFTATAPSGTFEWYDAMTGGTFLFSGPSYTIPALNGNTTVYVQNTVGNCVSPRTPVDATVLLVLNPLFRYDMGTFCTSGINPTPTVYNPGGTFSATPAGLVFVNTSTGQINVAASTPGSYNVKYTVNSPCPATTTSLVAITSTPDATFSYAGPYCQDAPDATPTFPAGSSPGSFSATPNGLTFRDPSTGAINLIATAPGTYTITNTIGAGGSCGITPPYSSTVTVFQEVIISAGPPQTQPAGTPVQLAGSLNIGTGTWSGGTGGFSNPTIPNPIYTPGPGETSATLKYTSGDPPGPCGPKSSLVTITFSPAPPTPPAPTASGGQVCAGNSITLSATAPGGSYEWFDAAGNPLAPGPNYTTPALLSTTNFFVQTTINGATSPKKQVTVTVNAAPAQPTPAIPPPVCSGNTATLSVSGSTGAYEWYDAKVGGNLLWTQPTFTTPVLTANTIYWVEATSNSCSSARVPVNVTVNPVPAITSHLTDAICSGGAVSYTITSDISGATFNWSRAAFPGISNPASGPQSTATINETLTNTTAAPINVTYVLTPTANSCTGQSVNYVVTVNPAPVITSGPPPPVCSDSPVNYTITFNTPGVTSTWSRAMVPGITNAAVSGQASATINEALINNTNAPINVDYIVNYGTSTCNGPAKTITVTVYPAVTITSNKTDPWCSGVPQTYTIVSNIPTATFSWSRAAVAGISNAAANNQTANPITEALVNTTTKPVIVTYIITPTANGCPGQSFTYKVTVNPAIATTHAFANNPVCTNGDIQLTTPTVAGATAYTWTAPDGTIYSTQNPVIHNATVAMKGLYTLTVTVGTCQSPVASVNVVVDPDAIVDVGQNPLTVCNNVTSVPLNGTIKSSTNTGFWSIVQGSGTIQTPITNPQGTYIPSAQDKANGSVQLMLSSTSPDLCSKQVVLTINFETDLITSAANGPPVCSGSSQSYTITASAAGSTFTWDRAAIPGISNAAVSNQTANPITEALVNTTNAPITVTYMITPLLPDGCPGKTVPYNVVVNPIPVMPVIDPVSPFCVNLPLHLATTAVPNATYNWTKPDGTVVPTTIPSFDIPSAALTDAGQYSLTVTVSSCTSPSSAPIAVEVDPAPVVTVASVPPQCIDATAVQLTGTSSTRAGMWSFVGTGSGQFLPNAQTINAIYKPSAADEASGSVTLQLTSASANNCNPDSKTVTIIFEQMPGVYAGPPQSLCSEDAVQLSGKPLVPGYTGPYQWTPSGDGKFVPSDSQLNTTYVPGPTDIKNGTVTLTLAASPPGTCYIKTSQLTVTLIPPPTVNAGGTRYVLKGKTITLDPVVSDNNVTYLWTPNVDLSDNTIKNPVVTGDADITYTLIVTDSRHCTNSDKVNIVVSPEIIIPNTFTPNNDGTNDFWDIRGLIAYQQATVDIFDRYGQKVFHSVGYPKPWDGTVNGKPVPFGTYYYVINTNMYGQVLKGYVVVVR